jgi:hypothetical protein
VSSLDHNLRQVSTDLTSIEQAFALVGGLAVSARAEPRLTRDADLAVTATSDSAAEQTVQQLVQRGYLVVATIEHDVTGRLATVRLSRDDDDGRVVTDLLFAS